MQNDKTTLRDLAIFGSQGEDVFSLIDRTTTAAGREALRHILLQPPDRFELLLETQEVVKWWSRNGTRWTQQVSNGTLVLLEKFFESADTHHAPGGFALLLGNFFQKLVNRNQYSFIQFSVAQIADLLRGCTELTGLLQEKDLPRLLAEKLEAIHEVLQHPLVEPLMQANKHTSYATLSRLAYRARRELKHQTYRLVDLFAQLDAWQAMGAATSTLGWQFPKLLPALPLRFRVEGLYHPLLESPVPYEIAFDAPQHFLFLTGANMSGKTTLMRALGLSALLAHVGMGVPARSMELSFLEGIITNMHVEDNLLRGESYFLAEVLRMKKTAEKLVGSGPHLVLMDELFKGTNVHDAYECTRAVVDGLLLHPHQLLVLSTHIHEAAHHFEKRSDICFARFITTMNEDGSFHFSYELKPGISDDRIGYRILQQEGVLDLLRHHTTS